MKRLAYCAYLFISVGALLLIGELGLWLAGVPVLDTRPVPDSQLDLKIAIFGESTAAGAMTEISFGRFLFQRFRETLPELKFHAHMFAAAGNTFHQMQAERLKAEIDNYDIFLILAGHNEYKNYLDRVGYFRKPRYKDHRELDRAYWKHTQPYVWLSTQSRLFTLSSKLAEALRPPPVDPEEFESHRRFLEYEAKALVPSEEIRRISDAFYQDLKEIVALASKKKKRILLASLPINAAYPPYFSIKPQDLDERRWTRYLRAHEQGREAFKKENWAAAVRFLKAAEREASDIAVNAYYLGWSLWHLNKKDEAQAWLRKSTDRDGFPLRAPSGLREALAAVVKDSPTVVFVDLERLFFEAQALGLSAEELFCDFQHPSLLGTYLMGEALLPALMELAVGADASYSLKGRTAGSLRVGYEEMKIQVGIDRGVESRSSQMAANFLYASASDTPYQKEYIRQAISHYQRIYDLAFDNPKARAIAQFYLALYDMEFGNDKSSCERLNHALQLDKGVIAPLLENYIPGRGYSGRRFAARGIALTPDQSRFICPTAELPLGKVSLLR